MKPNTTQSAEKLMQTLSNHAAWLMGPNQPLTVSEAPITTPGPDEILVRNRALAINPFDGVVQTLGTLITPWVKYPAILGTDVAGEVVAVGSSVSCFEPGNRVAGLALGIDKEVNRAAEGAFQEFVLLRKEAASRIPDSLSFERAAVLPLAISTAASGLFLKNQLNLQPPSLQEHRSTGKTLFIWGGSTSVGSCAIQLAIAAGYQVATTASPKTTAYVRGLGAQLVFDYTEKGVVQRIVGDLAGHELAGALSITAGSGGHCIDIVSQCAGPRFVAMASAPVAVNDAPLKRQLLWKAKRLPRIAMGFAGLALQARMRGVTTSSIWGTDLVKEPLGALLFQKYLEPALADGLFVPAPEPLVVGKSVKDIATAITRLQQGVSARKIVVSV